MADLTDTFYPSADDAIHGYAAQLMMGDGASPERFQAIAYLVDITLGQMGTEDIDVTHLRSPDAHREHMAGIRDSQAIEANGIWIPTDESISNTGGGSGPFADGGIVAKWRGRQNHNFKMVTGSPTSPGIEMPFRGYVNRFQPTAATVTTAINFTLGIMPNRAYDAAWP